MEQSIQAPQYSFELGPAISDTIVSWLNENGKNRTIQLPIEIHGHSLRIKSSYLYGGNTKIEILLDTGALSMNLPMHLKPYCNSYPCWVWLEGTWETLTSYRETEPLPVFRVRKVIGIP